jgi:pyruvate/2-oxoacid:ferredoxin oxidoreductase beta subunit
MKVWCKGKGIGLARGLCLVIEFKIKNSKACPNRVSGAGQKRKFQTSNDIPPHFHINYLFSQPPTDLLLSSFDTAAC